MTIPGKDYFPFIEGNDAMRGLADRIRSRVLNYVLSYNLKSLVLGMSGGIDSTLCAALLRPVCDEADIRLIGRSITIESNKVDEITRSVAAGKAFCHDFGHMDLTGIFRTNKELLVDFDDSMLSKLRQGNLKARMRMMVLYDLAQLHRGMVVSTDNYTEYLTGFWTLHGDVGDYAPLQHLWKTEVYNLARYLLGECDGRRKVALQSCIDAVPTDGLGISPCDCEQLGVADYYEADRIFAAYFAGDKSLLGHPLIKRYFSSEYKRNVPVCMTRDELVEASRP